MEHHSMLLLFIILAVFLAIVFLTVFVSSIKVSDENHGLKNTLRKRFWFSLVLTIVLGILTAVTLPKSPYFIFAKETPSKVIHVAALQFSFFMTEKEIDPKQPVGESIVIPLNQVVEFRVTSFDVNHGFAIYGPDMKLITQTQAMPGYVNSLRHKFTVPGEYRVLCLEFCGMGHQGMQTTFKVN